MKFSCNLAIADSYLQKRGIILNFASVVLANCSNLTLIKKATPYIKLLFAFASS